MENHKMQFGDVAMGARHGKRLSLREAARLLGMTPSYLSKIELSRCPVPSADVIRRMAALYDVSVDDLLLHAQSRTSDVITREIEEDPTFHNLIKLYRTADPNAEELLSIIATLIMKLPPEEREKFKAKQKADFTRVAKGSRALFAARVKPRFLSKMRIREMAERYLSSHGLTRKTYTPPTPIEELIERTELVKLCPSDSGDMTCDNDGNPLVLGLTRYDFDCKTRLIEINEVLYNSERPVDRQRLLYTLAHELFHAIEHLPLVDQMSGNVGLFRLNGGFIEKKERWCDKETKPRKLETNEDWQEWQAQQFAAEVLMPDWHLRGVFVERFGDEMLTKPTGVGSKAFAYSMAGAVLVNGKFVKPLNEVYGVSRQAMAIRLLELNLVNPE